jgi:hypothetical protein
MIGFILGRREATLRTGTLVTSILLTIKIKNIALGCQISFGSILTGMVPNQKWNGASFSTPIVTSTAQAKSAKYATSNVWQ